MRRARIANSGEVKKFSLIIIFLKYTLIWLIVSSPWILFDLMGKTVYAGTTRTAGNTMADVFNWQS